MKQHWLAVVLLVLSLVFAGFGCSGHKSDRSQSKDDESGDTAQPAPEPVTYDEPAPRDPQDSTFTGSSDYLIHFPESFDGSPTPCIFIEPGEGSTPQEIMDYVITDRSSMTLNFLVVVPYEPLDMTTGGNFDVIYGEVASAYNITADTSYVLDLGLISQIHDFSYEEPLFSPFETAPVPIVFPDDTQPFPVEEIPVDEALDINSPEE